VSDATSKAVTVLAEMRENREGCVGHVQRAQRRALDLAISVLIIRGAVTREAGVQKLYEAMRPDAGRLIHSGTSDRWATWDEIKDHPSLRERYDAGYDAIAELFGMEAFG
jgi:hypothetical protein